MKSAIICEGNTDLLLVQYFMEKVHNWKYIDRKSYKDFDEGQINVFNDTKSLKWFQNDTGCLMCIISAGGCSKLHKMLEKVLDLNKMGAVVPYSKVVVISDRDELGSEQDFFNKVQELYRIYEVNLIEMLENNTWNNSTYTNDIFDTSRIELLSLIIPFEDTGAIETFLLNALCIESEKSDPEKVDKEIINQCSHFIDTIDCKGKYLKHRREKTKAKFDTAFVVMTPAEAFNQRQTLLRSIPWEQYEIIQTSFKQLGKLSKI